MSHDRQIDDFKSGPICRGDQSIIYAWAMDAPQLDLPKGKTKFESLILTKISSTNFISI